MNMVPKLLILIFSVIYSMKKIPNNTENSCERIIEAAIDKKNRPTKRYFNLGFKSL